jgi:ABC-type transport system substrate-binding protein
MQWTSPVFSDIRFRKALNFAIDKEAIRKHLLAGQGTPVATLPGDVARTCGGNPALKPYPYDFEEAKRLIKEGRYEGYEFGVPVFDRSGFPEFPEVAETVVGYWQKVGLKPKIFMTEWNAWREKWRTQKSENTIMGVDSSAVSGCNGILRTFEQKLYSKSELTHVKLPYLDERFEKIFKSLDLTEVERLMGEMYCYTYDNYLVVPICDLDDIIATSKKIPPWDPGLRRRDLNFRGLIREQ